jgi:hypothetical protein
MHARDPQTAATIGEVQPRFNTQKLRPQKKLIQPDAKQNNL